MTDALTEEPTGVEGECRVSLDPCPRCNGHHDGLIFRRFGRQPEWCERRLTHWALCPTTGEPITRWELKQ